jgi:hypothetical protein
MVNPLAVARGATRTAPAAKLAAMTPTRIQWALAAVFFVLGGWALVAPQSVIDLAFLPKFRSGGEILPFAVACFGSQGVISGLFAAFSRFTRTTFLAYGVALLPFFWFDWWFTFVHPVFTAVGLLDAVGNVIMLVLCVMGWRALKPGAAAA